MPLFGEVIYLVGLYLLRSQLFLRGGVSVPDSTSERCFNRFNPGMCGGRREDRQNIDGPSTEFIAFIFTLLELQSPYFTA